MPVVSYQNGKVYKITHVSCTKCHIVSEAHAQRYLKECQGIEVQKVQVLLKECQGIELQKVQVLIPTTSIAHCKVDFFELHPSDNREEILQQEAYI